MITTLTKQLNEQLLKMVETGKLFKTEFPGDDLWAVYMASFTDDHDPVFRDPESTSHNCNNCKNFIRRYGNIVAIDDDYNIMTLFDLDDVPEEYKNSVEAMGGVLRGSVIRDVFFETFESLNKLPYEKCTKNADTFQLGVDANTKRYTKEEAEKYGVVEPNEIRKFHHFHLHLPSDFVDTTGSSIESIMARYRSDKNVFQRAMEDLSLDVLKLVKELIVQGSLLNGSAHLEKVNAMIPLKKEYDELALDKRDNWCWANSYEFKYAKFKNELIGVLCSELSEGEDLNKACQAWNKRVDPANYMKATAPITKRQIKEAQKFVEDNGYVESFDRRFATIDDIKVSEIKHVNSNDEKPSSMSIFDDVKPNKSTTKRRQFDNMEEVHIDDFMKDILPQCSKVELLLEGRLQRHMVSLTTANKERSKPIFKWDNNYSWTFNGNLAGKSQIKQAVKTQGGDVEGVLRFSIMWAEDKVDQSDLDAHCSEPNGNVIYYSRKRSPNTGGTLDIDIINPQQHKRGGHDVVENIAYPSLHKMDDGKYEFLVNPYNARNSQGFSAEIEFNGRVFQYVYDRAVSMKIPVAVVTLKDGEFSIEHKLPESEITQDIYGLDTNEFHKVNLVCLSPNHWRSNKVGNKHYFFMLEGCQAELPTRGFHVENLIPELLDHRKVMEVLANTTMIEPEDVKQLSGVGFNSTVRDHVIVRLSGNFKRQLKIKF